MPEYRGRRATTQMARNTRAPEGFRRRGAVCGVAARPYDSRLAGEGCFGIACVAAPAIRPRGARNATAMDFVSTLLTPFALYLILVLIGSIWVFLETFSISRAFDEIEESLMAAFREPGMFFLESAIVVPGVTLLVVASCLKRRAERI